MDNQCIENNKMTSVSSEVLRQASLSVSALRRISKWLTPTPCLRARQQVGNHSGLYLKAENLQRSGSFKYRGALAKLTSIATDLPVITASSGNHGLALASAAMVTGHRVRVVLPETVAREKLQKIEALGVETILHSDDAGLAERHAQDVARESGLVYISPYNDEQVIAGQGTIALELLQQLPVIDSVFVSMGGGGLISGIGSVVKAYSPQTKVIGVSATNSAALAASIGAARVVAVDHLSTLADGCAGSVDEATITLSLATSVIDEIIECTEQEIADALYNIAWEEKLLVEGSAALAFAAFLKTRESHKTRTSHNTRASYKNSAGQSGKVDVVILCGANFDREMVAPIIFNRNSP